MKRSVLIEYSCLAKKINLHWGCEERILMRPWVRWIWKRKEGMQIKTVADFPFRPMCSVLPNWDDGKPFSRSWNTYKMSCVCWGGRARKSVDPKPVFPLVIWNSLFMNQHLPLALKVGVAVNMMHCLFFQLVREGSGRACDKGRRHWTNNGRAPDLGVGGW